MIISIDGIVTKSRPTSTASFRAQHHVPLRSMIVNLRNWCVQPTARVRLMIIRNMTGAHYAPPPREHVPAHGTWHMM